MRHWSIGRKLLAGDGLNAQARRSHNWLSDNPGTVQTWVEIVLLLLVILSARAQHRQIGREAHTAHRNLVAHD